METGKIEEIININFSDFNNYDFRNLLPVLFVYDKTIYKISNYEELNKIYYYILYKKEEGRAIIDNYVGTPCFIPGKIYISKVAAYLSVPQKFSQELYINVDYDNINKNMILMKKVYQQIKMDTSLDIQIYFTSKENKNIDLDSIISTLTSHKKVLKNTKYFISYINGQCFTKKEKFYFKIEKQFNKKTFLGDIIIKSDEETFLDEYMITNLSLLNSDNNYKINYEKVFVYGLVRMAMKYYNEGTFWPFFKTAYGINLTQSTRNKIHEIYHSVMIANDKYYSDDEQMKITNISMQTFVTDKCADKFFDYLFSFWRIDLQRNIENLSNPQMKESFNLLIDKIKNNVNSEVMSHTAIAVKAYEKSCKTRIRNILKMIDTSFWNQTTIKESNVRIKQLLRKWQMLPNGKFLKEYKSKQFKNGIHKEYLLSSPQVYKNFNDDTFFVKFPSEILFDYNVNNDIYWYLELGDEIIKENANIMEGKTGYYSDEAIISLKASQMFSSLSAKLIDNNDKVYYKTTLLNNEEYRFFKEDGKFIDFRKSIPATNLICFSKIEEFPIVLGQEENHVVASNKMYVQTYNLQKGDILKFPDGMGLQVGNIITDGLNVKGSMDDVTINYNNDVYPVYNTLPTLLLRLKEDQFNGTSIKIKNMTTGMVSFDKITNLCYTEYYLSTTKNLLGYVVNLSSKIKNDGCYQISIDIPRNFQSKIYNLGYLKNFAYQFIDAPYVFTDTICLSISNNFKIDTASLVCEVKNDINNIYLNLNKNNPDNNLDFLEDDNLKLNYNLNGKKVDLYIKVPIFRWKYNINDEWNIMRPRDLFRNEIKDNLYVSGPFDFKSHDNYLFSANTDEILEYGTKLNNVYFYTFNSVKSQISSDIDKIDLTIKLNNKNYDLFTIYCHSIIRNYSLNGDFDKDILYGNFDIFGNMSYFVNISYETILLYEDIALQNGSFRLETNLAEGTYTVEVYELEEDEFGLGTYTNILGTYNVNLVNLASLQDCIIKINNIEEKTHLYQPLKLKYHYYIKDLIRFKDIKYIRSTSTLRTNNRDIMMWSANNMSLNQLQSLVFYEGMLGYDDKKDKDKFNITCRVLIIFKDITNLNDVVILRRTREEYVEVLYHKGYKQILANDLDFNKIEKLKFIDCLCDDNYDFNIEVINKKEREVTEPWLSIS